MNQQPTQQQQQLTNVPQYPGQQHQMHMQQQHQNKLQLAPLAQNARDDTQRANTNNSTNNANSTGSNQNMYQQGQNNSFGRPLTIAFSAHNSNLGGANTMAANGVQTMNQPSRPLEPGNEALGLFKQQNSSTLQHSHMRNNANLAAAPILSHSVGGAASSNQISSNAIVNNGQLQQPQAQPQVVNQQAAAANGAPGSYLSPLKRPGRMAGPQMGMGSQSGINAQAQAQQTIPQQYSQQNRQMMEIAGNDDATFIKNSRTFCYSKDPINGQAPIQNATGPFTGSNPMQNRFSNPPSSTSAAAGHLQQHTAENFGSETRPRRLTSHKQQSYPGSGASHEIRDSAVLVAGGYGVTTTNTTSNVNSDTFSGAIQQAANHTQQISYSSQQKQRTAPGSSGMQNSSDIREGVPLSNSTIVAGGSGRVDSRTYLGNGNNGQGKQMLGSAHKTNSSMDMRRNTNSTNEENQSNIISPPQQQMSQQQVPRSHQSKERLNMMRTSAGHQNQELYQGSHKIVGSEDNQAYFIQNNQHQTPAQSMRNSSIVNMDKQKGDHQQSSIGSQEDKQVVQSMGSSRPRIESSPSHKSDAMQAMSNERRQEHPSSTEKSLPASSTNVTTTSQPGADQNIKDGDKSQEKSATAQNKPQQPKIPVICGFHKQMLLLTCQYFTSAHHNNPQNNPNASAVQGNGIYPSAVAGGGPFGYGVNPTGFNQGPPGLPGQMTGFGVQNGFPGAPLGQNQPQGASMVNPNSIGGQSQIKRIRNKNPNCNHNSSSVFYQPQFNNVKFDESHRKKEDVLRKVFFKECSKEEQKRGNTEPPSALGGPSGLSGHPALPITGPGSHNLGSQFGGLGGRHSATLAAGSQIMKPSRNDPYTLLKIVDHVLSELMYNKEPIDRTKPLSSAQTVLLELELQSVHSAHKAFLLALIRSGKVNIENLYRVLAEVKHSGSLVDSQCIYCKYSQFALKESTKVQLQQQQQAQQNGNSDSNGQTSSSVHHNGALDTTGPGFGNGPVARVDSRIEHLVKMFQTQLFKKSFITTSLLIIQRRMNEKYIFRQRANNQQNNERGAQGVSNSASSSAGQPMKRPINKEAVKKKQEAAKTPANILENLANQIQKLAKNLANPKDKEKYMELKERHYREFLHKVNRSNNYEIKFPTGTFPPYKYYIGRGNNSILVRAALKTRFWWSMGDFDTWDEYNFLWTQWRSGRILDCIKSKSDTEKLRDASTHQSESLLSTQPTDKDSSSSVENLITTPKRQQSKGSVALSTLKKAGSNSNNVPSTSTNIHQSANKGGPQSKVGKKGGKEDEEKEENCTQHSTISTNHMDANFHLSNKKAIYYNMKVYYESTGQFTFDYLPLTYHITEGVNSKEFEKFVTIFNDPESSSDLRRHPSIGHHLWIVKPGENTNQGCGINVCRDLSHIKGIVTNTNHGGKKRSYIIQKYIERPLLYKNRKFDIRAFMMTVTVGGNLQAYWYQDGYLRTSCKEYNTKNVTSKLVHLTNDSIQKRCDDYGRFESGNKLSYNEFQKYMDSSNIKCDFIKTCLPQMKKMGTDSIRAVSRKIDPSRKQCTFEIFGYDFMIDDIFKPWLIEVNTNPCLELSSPYLARLIPTMIEHALKIAIDPIFPPPPVPPNKRHQIPDAQDNRFELVFNERDDAAELKNLPIDDTINGIIEEDELEDEATEEEDEEENHP